MKAWVPLPSKTSTNPSISQQNEKPLLPSAFLKREGFLSGTRKVSSLAIELTVVKTNQTHFHVSTDRCLLFSLEAYEGFTFLLFFFFNIVYKFCQCKPGFTSGIVPYLSLLWFV